jgi:transcriptional regulator with XRE-family HTH domain
LYTESSNQYKEQKFLDLRELREKAGLRREQVAVALNKSHTTISNWETGRFIPTLTPTETLLVLKTYDCTLDEFEQAALASTKKRRTGVHLQESDRI